MATYSLLKLSGSTDGKGVKVTGTATGATVTVHTAHATSLDLISLWAVNNNATGVSRTLTLEWGGATDPDNVIVVSVPCKTGPVFICDQLLLTNSLIVKAFADAANDVVIYGTVRRVT